MGRLECASVLAVAAVAIAPTLALGQSEESTDVGFALGSPDAPLTVIEFGDFACSACATFARTTWPAVRTRYVETGRVRWHMMPFELGFRNSEEGARAAHCAADQDVFWAMHDLLFLRRDEWVERRNPRDALVALAARAGADAPQFAECYEGERMDDRMKAANRMARSRGVRGTPTFFIDGVPVQGALSEDVFLALLEEALAGSGVGSLTLTAYPKSAIRPVVPASKPITSSIPASSGSAMLNPLDAIATTTLASVY